MGSYQISAAFQDDREGKAFFFFFYIECNIADCICEGKKTGQTAPKHVFLSNMPRQLGNRRYTSWIQPKKWSAASMNLAEERAR